MNLCVQCLSKGFCEQIQTRIVSDEELSNPDFVRDVRNFSAGLAVDPNSWLEALYNMYCQYPGSIVDRNGRELFLDLEHFEVPYIREWFRDWACSPIDQNVRPRVREESRERIRVLGTVLKAKYPEHAMLWGVRPANDNAPIKL
ncbi:hypothetical protein [Hyphomonas jannaschiana]|uniref:Uncharacterized protein n=1 Tax=Hyphomonas jannaschiana VP2 TaxID=1280952 RepID=A0A059FGH5_9PROT|nr:hypothetical protein [Hyphomonas jannaschiana]KCZ89734.1 hypothetical protein HJA_05767 [Hyphomonas jannaschiana VP2]